MFYSKCFSWTERGLHERRKNDFPLIYLGWADFLRVFSSYFFPHYSVFPIHLLSSLCSLSPMPLLQRCETFLPQKPGKNCQVAFVIVSQCDTEQSFSILTDFLRFSEPSAMSMGSSLSPPRVTKPLLANQAAVPFLHWAATFQLQHFLEKECLTKLIFKASAGFWKLLRNISFSWSPLHAWLPFP